MHDERQRGGGNGAREEQPVVVDYKDQAPSHATLDNARNLLKALFFDPKRYDLTKVGRYKLNQRLGVGVPEDTRVLTTEDIIALVRKLVDLPVKLGLPEDSKDFAADGAQLSRDAIRGVVSSNRQKPESSGTLQSGASIGPGD